MATLWPPGLPQIMPLQIQHGVMDTNLPFKNEAGDTRVKTFYSKAPEILSFVMFMNGTQKLTLMDFAANTLKNRTLPFEWWTPDGDAGNEDVRFWFFSKPLLFQLKKGGASDADRIWTVKLNMTEDLYGA